MASHPIQYQRTYVHIRIYTPHRRHKIERNNRRPTGRGSLWAESRGCRGPAPSVRTPTEQAGFQESLQGTRRGLSGCPALPHSRAHTRGSGLGELRSACFFPQLRSPTARREAPRSALHSTRPDGRSTGWERRELGPPTGVTRVDLNPALRSRHRPTDNGRTEGATTGQVPHPLWLYRGPISAPQRGRTGVPALHAAHGVQTLDLLLHLQDHP